jgi:hypothetical protein
MTSLVQVLSIAVSLLLLGIVLDLVRRRRLTEEYSVIWIACAIALVALATWREILHTLARWLGVHYPPAVLVLVILLFVFVACLGFSIVISGQRRQIERLAEEVAMLAARQREAAREREAAGDERAPRY